MKKVDVIAIDGPSGSGKSTIAKILSEKLGYEYISTGAMYRLVGLIADEKGIFDNDDEIYKLMNQMKKDILFQNGKIFYKNVDYSNRVYENRVSMLASEISQREIVRKVLGEMQREIGLKQKSVLEGRDIGTVIFPDAEYKYYLDASYEERAKRRFEELKKKGEKVEYGDILNDIIKRDKNDSDRELAPLRKAEDAVYIDTSKLTLKQVVEKIINSMKEAGGNEN